MRNIITLLISTLLCGCYDSFDTPSSDSSTPTTNLSLTELKSLYSGETFVVESDIVIDGWVTSSDKSDNFYRSFIIEEQGAAVEIMAGIYDLWHIYPTGYNIVVNLNGLAVSEKYGIIQVGKKAEAYDGYDVVYISSKVALDKHVYRTSKYVDIKPITTTIESLREDMCGMLICIDDLIFSPEPESVESTTWSGYKRFEDKNGDYIWTSTRNYASFADNNAPLTKVSLTGIMQIAGAGTISERYILKLRNEEDCSQ